MVSFLFRGGGEGDKEERGKEQERGGEKRKEKGEKG